MEYNAVGIVLQRRTVYTNGVPWNAMDVDGIVKSKRKS